jgi:hypothetical protein
MAAVQFLMNRTDGTVSRMLRAQPLTTAMRYIYTHTGPRFPRSLLSPVDPRYSLAALAHGECVPERRVTRARTLA